MDIQLSVSSILQNLAPGEVVSIPLKENSLLKHPVWQDILISGQASLRLCREQKSDSHNSMLVRMGSGLSAPSPKTNHICHLCSSQKMMEVVQIQEMSIVVCSNCYSGIVQDLKSSPTATSNADDYSNRYSQEFQEEKTGACWQLLQERTENLQGIKSILDIGCGSGAFLDLARAKGMSTSGLEIAPTAALDAIQKGHEVYCNSVEIEAFPPGSQFDLIVMWDILEHLSMPQFALSNVFKLMAVDGRLFILTPMMGSICDRWGIRLSRLSGGRFNQLLQMCWSQEHLFRFHPHGIEQALRSLGFIQVKVEPVLLLSLKSDCYAGGRILKSWTGHPLLDSLISKLGVKLVQALSFNNKILIEAVRGADEIGGIL
jgi:2-polyprenyl-3-methyl-5-hydroxy-6-metoxy-1,4-benzoquinol methylase